MDDKLPTKTAKFTSLENLYVYGIASFVGHDSWFVCSSGALLYLLQSPTGFLAYIYSLSTTVHSHH